MTDSSHMLPIPAGALFTVSTGAYSSYCIHGVFRATRDLNTDALIEAYLVEHPKQREKYRFENSDFMGWLAQKGLLERVEAWEWHLDDLGKVSEMYVDTIG